MLVMWRLGMGKLMNAWPDVFGRIMVILHTGRVTGLPRKAPVNYTIIDDDIYCTAGFGTNCDWYQNILKTPGVEVWLPDGWWFGEAEDVTAVDNSLDTMREVLIASGFAAWLFGMFPKQMSDEELASITKDYRLIRIRRLEPRTGPDGPGDLAWVWQIATFLLLPLVFCRRKRR